MTTKQWRKMRQEDTKCRLQVGAKTSPLEKKTYKNFSFLIECSDDEFQDLWPLSKTPRRLCQNSFWWNFLHKVNTNKTCFNCEVSSSLLKILASIVGLQLSTYVQSLQFCTCGRHNAEMTFSSLCLMCLLFLNNLAFNVSLLDTKYWLLNSFVTQCYYSQRFPNNFAHVRLSFL